MLAKMTPSTLRVARAALLGTMLALLATILVFVAVGPARRVPQASVPILPQQADAGLQGFSFTQSKGGLVDWKIQARQAQLFEADAKAVLNDNVQVTLMGADGVTLTVTGDEGTINTASKDFVISKYSGNLALILNSGFTIYTPRIRWDNQTLRIWTDEPVRITGPRLEVTGQGMDAFLVSREMRVRRNVRVGIH
ncbi:MAG TPA: LPS export ABC transporter periplasmic protein LptC [Nitrospirales bacterium]|jgi:lipopolysaccharide export system protein LptC|nr:LPS export ABC transporter periplasmic protein LptC [Nitrospirales bacterium]